MIGLEILMTPFATWGVIIWLIAMAICITWIFARIDATTATTQEDEHDDAR